MGSFGKTIPGSFCPKTQISLVGNTAIPSLANALMETGMIVKGGSLRIWLGESDSTSNGESEISGEIRRTDGHMY